MAEMRKESCYSQEFDNNTLLLLSRRALDLIAYISMIEELVCNRMQVWKDLKLIQFWNTCLKNIKLRI